MRRFLDSFRYGRSNRIYDLDYDAERRAREGYFRERPRNLLVALRPPIGNRYRPTHRRVERWIDECRRQDTAGYERYDREGIMQNLLSGPYLYSLALTNSLF